MRVTTAADSKTGNSVVVPALGDRNVWSADSSHALYIDNSAGTWYVVTLNLASWPNAGVIGAKVPLPLALPYFSYLNNDLVYGLDGTWASTYRVSMPSAPPVHIFDFSTVPGWNSNYYALDFTISGDDRFLCSFNGPEQDAGSLVVCRDTQANVTYSLDISQNTVNGQSVTGYLYPPGMGGIGYGLHALDMGMSNRYLQIQAQNSTPPVYWDLLSPNATYLLAETQFAANHSASGFNMLARGHGPQCAIIGNSDGRVFTLKPFAEMAIQNDWLSLDQCPPVGQETWDDENHWSWGNDSNANPALTDKYPVFANITMHVAHNPQLWIDDELVAFETDGVQEQVWHFFHNYTSYAPTGCPAYLVGPHVSRDGRWVLFNSDWMGALGPGQDCTNRMDVFLAELKTNAQNSPAAVTVNPQSVTLNSGISQQFSAAVSGTAGGGVTWSMNPGVGAISTSGLYVAPVVATAQTLTITAAAGSGTASGTATVTVLPPISVAVTPQTASLSTGQTVQLMAAVSQSGNTAVIWSLSPQLGSISAGGLYTAPSYIASSQTVTATATSVADPTKWAAAVISLNPNASGLFTPIRVNAGGGNYTDAQGFQWTGDTAFTGGDPWSTPNSIANTSDTTLYQTCRYGVFGYTFNVPNATYNVILKFAEVSQPAAGMRVFNVAINGTPVLTNFDVFAAAGGEFIALDKTFPVTVTGGQISIQFTNGPANSPLINAIEIVTPPVSVTPGTATLGAAQTAQFRASVPVVWSLSPSMGSISAGGMYTAPASIPAAQTVTVTATNAVDATNTASAVVTLTPGAGVTIAPTNAALGAGGTQQFTSNGAVVWSISPAVGSIGSSGLYTAPATVASSQAVTVTATSAANPANSASAIVTLTAAVSVTMTPGTAALAANGTLQFLTTVSNTSNLLVTWSLSPAVGSIGSSGLYTAPSTVNSSQTVTVTATSVADPTKSASAVITLVPPVSVSVTPGTASLGGGATQQLSAAVGNTSNTSVTWSLSPAVGSIGSSGLYTAPSTVNSSQTVTVTATSVADPTKSASAVITLVPAVSILVTPGTTSLGGGATQQFSATVGNTSNTSVTWSLSPAVGSIGSSGLYAAPATVLSSQTVTVTATSVADATKSASAVVTLTPAVSIQIAPGSASLTAGKTQQFTAAVSNTNNTSVTWSLSPAVGSLTSSGLYTAPAAVNSSQTVTVTATSVADPTKSASAAVTLTPTVAVSVQVAPATASLSAGQGQQFSAAVNNTSNTSVTWSLSPAVGSLTSSGLYTAPATVNSSQTVTVTATSVADPTKSASAAVTLTPTVTVSVQVAPATASLSAGQAQQFSAAVSNTSNTSVTWSLSPAVGSITAGGLYTAPSPINGSQTVTVTATSAADPTKSASATLSLTTGNAQVAVSVTPGLVTLNAGSSQQFTATVSNAKNTNVVWSVSPAVGVISSSGLYTSLASANTTETVTVTATSMADATKSASALVTVLPAASSPGFTAIRVNAGGGAYSDAQGNIWSADAGFSGGTPCATSHAIASTNSPGIYQACRSGNSFSYQFGVPNGSYNVTLKFAEISQTAAGKRVFNVAINGTTALANFDIFAAAGGEFTAIDESFPVTVTNGQVAIRFTSSINVPLISGIQITTPLIGGGTAAAAFNGVRVNAGGGDYSDPQGNLWSADAGYSGGAPWSVSNPIANTTSAVLYQTCRYGGNFSYQFAVPNGTHTVVLKFAEVSQAAAGMRIFNVAINGAQVLTNFDIFLAAGGEFIAIDESFPVNVTNGQVVIQFTSTGFNSPLINGIQIM